MTTADRTADEMHVRLALDARITADTAGLVWRSALTTLDRTPDGPLVFDASGLGYIDDAGIALLFDGRKTWHSLWTR